MLASTVWINGVRLGEYKGGYTPFSFDLTPHVDFAGENVLVVDLDSTERPDIPPFGYQVDYLTFGGIYREMDCNCVTRQRCYKALAGTTPSFCSGHLIFGTPTAQANSKAA